MALSSKKMRPSGPCCPQKTLIRFATLMGTFRMKETEAKGHKRSRKPVVPCNQALSQLLLVDDADASSEDPVASFPSLALHNDDDDHLSSNDKHQVEAAAASNLSRPIIVVPRDAGSSSTGDSRTISTGDSCDADPKPMPISKSTKKGAKMLMYPADEPYSSCEKEFFEANEISNVPQLMLENLAGSFSLLLDARLRAYATFLSRHGASLANCPSMSDKEREETLLALDHKLATLLEIGTHTSVDAIVTSFHVQSVVENRNDDKEEKVSMPLLLEAVMDVSIPNLAGGKDCVTVSVRVPGKIHGSFDHGSNHSRLKSVHVDVDASELLEALVDRAGLIMSVAVEKVNATVMFMTVQSVSFSELTTAEEATHDDMPPPQPRNPKRKQLSSDDPLPIVSPDIGALSDDSRLLSKTPPPLQLDEESSDCLTPERCANIVDSIIGEMDSECFEPPVKRKRLFVT